MLVYHIYVFIIFNSEIDQFVETLTIEGWTRLSCVVDSNVADAKSI